MARKNKFPFKPNQLVEVREGCSITDDDGIPHTFQTGTRIRANHPAVQAAPALFKEIEPEFLPEVEQATAGPGEKRGD